MQFLTAQGADAIVTPLGDGGVAAHVLSWPTWRLRGTQGGEPHPRRWAYAQSEKLVVFSGATEKGSVVIVTASLEVRKARQSAPYDPDFATHSSLFWPLAGAIERLPRLSRFPTGDELSAAFPELPVTFRSVPRVSRRQRRKQNAMRMYDEEIVEGRRVPTRVDDWHDLLNALVWATFPEVKLALHERQHAFVSNMPRDEKGNRSGRRERAHDALAMLDEGGVVVISAGAETLRVLFGHALYEGLVLQWPTVVARKVSCCVPCLPGPKQALALAAEALLSAIEGDDVVPEGLGYDVLWRDAFGPGAHARLAPSPSD